VVAPGLQSLGSGVRAELEEADLRFVDGTFFTDEELRGMRPGAPDARSMGHVPVSGPEGSLAVLAGLPGRSFYLHLNNTNPLVDRSSPERARVEEAGVGVAEDGMELSL
jgi:pyrroloquinoline quinone biosynthesis protein B